MKTYTAIYKFMKALSLVAMTMVLANCGKSDSGGGGATTTTGYYVSGGQCYYNNQVQTALSVCQQATTTYYGYVGGQCYQVGAGVYQPSTNYSLCQNQNTTNGYQMINGQCYQNGVQVNYQLCQQYGGNGYGTTCNGYYLGRDNYGQSAVAQCTEGMTGVTYQYNVQTPWGYAQSVTVLDCSGLTLQNAQGQTQSCQ